jgi:delta(3,5)-delta(2,4)-dienoyl-CoA isomerase
MWQNLRLIFQRLSHSPSIRSIVLTGAGDRAFTSGLDVQAAAVNGPLSAGQQEQGAVEMDAARKAFHLTRYILDFQACISEIEKCEKPVICVLHGVCFGLAMDIALACTSSFPQLAPLYHTPPHICLTCPPHIIINKSS